MSVVYKICIDCADPHRLAAFWAQALEYVIEDHSALIQFLLDQGQVTDADVTTVDGRLAWREAAAVRDPDGPVDTRSGVGLGGRVLFQVVPEGKFARLRSGPELGEVTMLEVKNKVHLDLHVGAERRGAVVAGLVEAGGSVLWEANERGSSWVTMADPEGNEFCVT
jgi:hypothetical protein